MRRQFEIRIHATVVWSYNDQSFVLIIETQKIGGHKFFSVMSDGGFHELRMARDCTDFVFKGSVRCPDARFLKVLLIRLNNSSPGGDPEKVIDSFNRSFPIDPI